MNGLRLQRNCSASPKLLVAVLGGVSAWSLLISLGFWAMGAPRVLPFAGLEVLLLLGAFAVHSRRVTDSDTLWLTDMFAGMRETSFALARQAAKKFQ